jgi:hypothetical protein
MLTENPDFIKHAYKFKITSPLSHDNPAFNKFVIEDPNTNQVYEVEPLFEDAESRYYEIENHPHYDDANGTEEVTKYTFSIVNPLDGKKYMISGEKTSFRTKEGENDIIIGSFKEEFLIYEGRKEVGKIMVKNPDPDPIHTFEVIIPIEVAFYSKSVHVEYQKIMNKKYLSFKDENGLISLIEFGSEEFIAVKYKGEAFIKQGLASELRSDIIVMFMITDTVMSIMEKVRF